MAGRERSRRQLGGFIALSIVHSMKSIGKGGGNQELNGQEYDKRGGDHERGCGTLWFFSSGFTWLLIVLDNLLEISEDVDYYCWSSPLLSLLGIRGEGATVGGGKF